MEASAVFASQSERQAVREWLVNVSATGSDEDSDKANRLLNSPFALWRAENQIARKHKEEGAGAGGTIQDFLTWLLANAPQILALVAEILKMFGL